jgi:hypothetical protein
MKVLVLLMFVLTPGIVAWWAIRSARHILRTGVVKMGWKGKGLSRKEYPGIFWYFVIGQFVSAVFCAILTIVALFAAWQVVQE